MLSQLMNEVAAEAVARKQKADEAYFTQMKRNIAAKSEKWAERISSLVNA